jgi:hypothetical protein
MSIKVRWSVDDEYLGGTRPHYSKVDIGDFQHCETEQQVRDTLYELIREDFEQRIGFNIANEAEIVDEWRKSRPESE